MGEKQLRQILASKAVSETEVKDMLAGEKVFILYYMKSKHLK